MRWGALVILAAVLTGCASRPQQTASTTQPVIVTSQATLPWQENAVVYDSDFHYAPAIAQPLAFDPVRTRGGQSLDLTREGREPEAFAGYDEGVASYFYIRVD